MNRMIFKTVAHRHCSELWEWELWMRPSTGLQETIWTRVNRGKAKTFKEVAETIDQIIAKMTMN